MEGCRVLQALRPLAVLLCFPNPKLKGCISCWEALVTYGYRVAGSSEGMSN